MATSTDSSVKEERQMSEGSAAAPDPANQVMTNRLDLNLTVEENLLIRVSWYKDKYDEALKENAALRKELAEANQLLKRGYEDDRRRQKRVRDEEATSYGDQAHRKNKYAPFAGRWSAPPPSYQQRRQYSPGHQSKYCKICHMRNHSTEECRVRTGACFCCGDIGHKKYECPKFKDFKKPWHQVRPIDNVPKKDYGSPSQKTEEKL